MAMYGRSPGIRIGHRERWRDSSGRLRNAFDFMPELLPHSDLDVTHPVRGRHFTRYAR
jgi:hypothetical protein